jgi:hypothetical protein
MPPLNQAVLWVDPGRMTGVICWEPPGKLQFCKEHLFMEAGTAIEAACRWYKTHLLVGWEHFTIFPKTPPADAHYAIEMIGVTRRLATQYNCKILEPAQPDQRNLATPEMCKALGWWVPGKDDAQSAAQHMLAWMMRTDCLPNREAGILARLRATKGKT